MKILHVVPTYLPATRYGGPIFAVHGLAKAQVQLGHEIDVFTTNVNGDGTSDVPVGQRIILDGVGVTYYAAQFRRLYWSPSLGRALSNKAASVDVVHAHSIFLWPTLAAARAAKTAQTPYVITPRGMLVPELIAAKSTLLKRTWIELFEKRNLRHAAAVHYTSPLEQQDAVRAGFDMGSSFVIPNGIDIPPVMDVERLPRRIVYLGRISWKKRIHLLIEALRFIPGGELVIAGNDEEGLTPRLRQIATDCGVADRITWSGPVNDCQKFALLASAAVFCLPSISENFGNVALESLSQETPAVLTSGVGVAADLTCRGAALTVADSPEAIAAAVSSLLLDPERARVMGSAGRRVLVDDYSWSTVANAMDREYARIIRENGGR